LSFRNPAQPVSCLLRSINEVEAPSRIASPSDHVASPPANNVEIINDDNWQPQAHGIVEPVRFIKRKHRATVAEDNDANINLAKFSGPLRKKIKVQKDSELEEVEPVARPKNVTVSRKNAAEKKKASPKTEPKTDRVAKSTPAPKTISSGKTWADQDHGKKLDMLARAEQKRPLTAQNKHITAVQKVKFVKVSQGAATVKDHEAKVKKLKVQIKHKASALGPGISRNRDIGGKTNKFDRQDANKALNEGRVGAWKGSKWQDKDDENMTWFKIPGKQKTLSLSGRMVPVDQIVAQSAGFPEFTYIKKEMVENPRTGKLEVGFYTITHEKLEPEQAAARAEVMIQQAKAEAAQRRKDEAAERRSEKRATKKRRALLV
jgi:hypothetical protein